TEGALKAGVATEPSGTLTIGLPGVNASRRAGAVLRKLGATTARVAFDADARGNSNVAHQPGRLAAGGRGPGAGGRGDFSGGARQSENRHGPGARRGHDATRGEESLSPSGLRMPGGPIQCTRRRTRKASSAATAARRRTGTPRPWPRAKPAARRRWRSPPTGG